MARKAKQTDGKEDFDLTDTFWGPSFNDEVKSLSSSLPYMHTDFHENYSEYNDQDHDKTSAQLSMEQHQDPDTSVLFDRALDEKKISQTPVCFYVKNGILMRKWRSPYVLAEDEWTVNHQFGVPRFMALKY